MKKLRLKFYPGLAKSKEGKKEKAQQRGKASKESRSAAVEVSLNGDTGDDETSSLFGEASKFHKPGEYTVDQDTGHIIWFVISFNLICFSAMILWHVSNNSSSYFPLLSYYIPPN